MRARVRERLPRIGLARLLGRHWGQVQEFTHGFDRFGAIGAGEQAVVAEAVSAAEWFAVVRCSSKSP
jgi:hypothetical protein